MSQVVWGHPPCMPPPRDSLHCEGGWAWWDACTHRQLIIVSIAHYCPLDDLDLLRAAVTEGGGFILWHRRVQQPFQPLIGGMKYCWWKLKGPGVKIIHDMHLWPILMKPADIWIRRMIKAIRLWWKRLWGGGVGGSRLRRCQELSGSRDNKCVRARGGAQRPPHRLDLGFEYPCNCPKTAHQRTCLPPLGSNNMVWHSNSAQWQVIRSPEQPGRN